MSCLGLHPTVKGGEDRVIRTMSTSVTSADSTRTDSSNVSRQSLTSPGGQVLRSMYPDMRIVSAKRIALAIPSPPNS